MSTATDAIVIGAGVIGASVAFELAKSGRRVVVVDKASAPGQGSTSASSAVVRFNYPTRDGVAIAWEAQRCWTNWRDHLGFEDPQGMAKFHRAGMVVLDVPVISWERAAALFDEVGIPYEHWDATTFRTRVSGIDTGRYWPPKRVDEDAFFDDPDGEVGGLFTPDAGYVDDPQLAARNLAAAAERHGAVFMFGRTVTGVVRNDDHVEGVSLDDGTTLSAPVVVNVAGPWSAHVNRLARVGDDFTVTTRPMRQEVHQVAAPSAYALDGDQPPMVADLDLGTYSRPAGHGNVYIGGTEPACDPFEWLDDPDDANPNATQHGFEAQVTRFARRVPDLEVPGKPSGIAGVYDVTEDWTPIYDRTALDGYYVAIGTSGNQFKNAPLVGRIMVTIIEGIENGVDHDADPMQYIGEHTGHPVNLGTFSRKRELVPNTSGTVLG